ncbi:MAG: amino acid permease [Dehalococcoidia bacterium]|nr:amino acid permease [Dehalococcoidia bacterium]
MEKGKGGLKREVGLFGVIAFAAGSVIGAGPMVLAGGASALCGPAVWLAYIIIGIPLIIVAISYAGVASAMPVEGGTYYYPSRIYSPFWGFLSGWTRWLAYITPIAVTAIAFSDHIHTVAPVIPAVVLMVGFIGIFYILNVLGIKISSIAQVIMFSILVVGLLVFGFKGLTSINSEFMTPMQPFGFSGTVKAAALLFFAYVGFTMAAEIGEEVKNPGKNVPRGMVIGILLCVFVYVVMSVAASGNLIWSEQAASSTPIFDAGKVVLPAAAATIFLLVVIMAVSTSQNAFQLGCSRMLLTLGRDKVIPEKLSSVNPRFGTPIWALSASVLIALIFIASGKGLIFACYTCNLNFLFSYITVMVATIFLPRNKPDLYEKAPFKLKGAMNYVLPIIAIVVSIIFMALQEPMAMVWTAVWIAIGLGIYFVRKSQLAKVGVKLEDLLKRMPEEME